MPYLWMLLGSIAFALMALLAESLREQFTFPWISMIRSGIATALAVGLAMWARVPLAIWRPRSLWFRSLSGWASMICGFYAMTHYNVAIVLALTNMYPIWVAVLSWPLLRQVPAPSTWLALAASTLGMWLVYASAISDHVADPQVVDHPLAIPMAILAGVFSGFALIGLHKIKQVDRRAIVAHFSGVSTVLSLVVWLLLPIEAPPRNADTFSLFRLVSVGVIATIGQLFLTRAFSTGHPARVSVVGLSQIVVAAIAKWLIDGQIPTPMSLLGMALVVVATLAVMLQSVLVEPDE